MWGWGRVGRGDSKGGGIFWWVDDGAGEVVGEFGRFLKKLRSIKKTFFDRSNLVHLWIWQEIEVVRIGPEKKSVDMWFICSRQGNLSLFRRGGGGDECGGMIVTGFLISDFGDDYYADVGWVCVVGCGVILHEYCTRDVVIKNGITVVVVEGREEMGKG